MQLRKYDYVPEKENEVIELLEKRMKILIMYGTKYGCTKKCVETLKTLLNGDTTILSAKNIKVNVDRFDTVIIDCSAFMEKTQKEVSQFCQKNKRRLLKKS